MMQGPVIRSLRYYDQTVPVNTQRIECSVKSRWAVKEARIEGKDWPVTEENGIYTAEIPENGSFVFTVTDQLGQSVRQGFRIGNIDRITPVYRNYTENGDMVVLRFGEGESEVMSGIDWDNTCFRDAKGNTVTPRAVNRQTDEALLPKDSFPLEAKVEDFAGNYGTYRLTSHMIRRGHREIGFVGSIKVTSSIMDRFLGYYRAMLLNDLQVREEWILPDRGLTGGLVDPVLPEELPTAFVCNCDITARMVIRLLREKGLRVPQDVSVTGFDDFPLGGPGDVPLSTFRIDTNGMIELAIKSLLERCAGVQKPFGRLVVGGQPIYRESEIPCTNSEL